MDASKTKACARCKVQITCCVNDIDTCDCTKVPMEKEEHEFIKLLFHDCLCNDCLMDLKKEYQLVKI